MQLAAAATLTRFLLPSDYGLAAMAMLCSAMTGYFTQLGVGGAIIQRPGLTTGNIRAAFTLTMSTGILGFFVLAAISPLLAIYFREPRLTLVIVAFGLNLIFRATGAVSAGLLRREFRMRDLAICDFLAYLLSTFGVGLPMAMHGYGVWALVGSNVSQPLIASLAYFIARPHPIAPAWERESYAHITGFSAKASLTTTFEALGGSMDMIVMGRIISPVAIGLYNRSLTLSTQATYNVAIGLDRVFYPTLARAAERGKEACCEMLKSSERQLMSLVLPLCAGAATAAPTIIPVIFGRQWSSAVPVYQVLCIVAALDASFHLPSIQLEILRRFRYKMLLQTCFALCFGTGILIFAPRGGVIAVAMVYAALQLLRTLGIHLLSARYLGVPVLSLLESWTPGIVCSTLLTAVLLAVQRGLPTSMSSASPLKLAALVLLSGATVVLVYRTFYESCVYKQWRALFQR